MNAIPLKASNGTIYTWACGICHHVRAGVDRMLRNKPKDVRELAESHRAMAEDCCQCRRCNGLIEAKSFGSMHCGKCAPVIAAEMQALHVEQEAKDAASVVVLEKALSTSPDRVSALALRDLMREISEAYRCAGWLSGLENDLWRMLQGGSRRYGMGEVTDAEIDQLRTLHERCGGWWVYTEGHGEMFIATADWLKRRPASDGQERTGE